MIRFVCMLTLLVVVPASVQSQELTLQFEGTITSVIDANAGSPIDFTPIPVGSTFSGTYSYDVNSPATDGQTGYMRYLDLLSSGGAVTINGFTFESTAGGGAIVSSQEANFGFSGMSISSQPMSLPAGWDVEDGSIPYFTLRFMDASPQTRSLDLPSSEAEIPTDTMALVVDFLQPVVVDGVEYGQRVFINAEITSLTVFVSPPSPAEVAIDVDPSSVKNEVNLSAKKPLPLKVAVFGSADFNVLEVDAETIALGDPLLTDPDVGNGQKAPPTNIAYQDVNGDGVQDLLLTFSLVEMKNVGAIDSLSKSLEFEALLNNQGVVFGSDAVSILGKGKGRN